MNKDWENRELDKSILKIAYTNKIKRKDFKESGLYPIISQEKDIINGYWDNDEDVFRIEQPIVIFGDHTRIVKYIDFDFVLGADGVKILIPKKGIDPKFFYYFILNVELDSLGYARHYRLLKNVRISYPKSLSEQHRIVSILDQSFAAIDKAKANAEQNLANSKEIFESYLNSVFEGKGEDWEEKKLGEVCEEIFAGGDAPKNNFSKTKNEIFKIPIYANSVKNNGLYGFTDYARVTTPSVTIAARGSGTGHTEIRYESYLPIVRLIVCIPDNEKINLRFLKTSIDNLNITRSGSAIPQLTIPMIKDYIITLPPLSQQHRIVEKLESLQAETQKLEAIYKQKIAGLDELKKSLLEKAFKGEL